MELERDLVAIVYTSFSEFSLANLAGKQIDLFLRLDAICTFVHHINSFLGMLLHCLQIFTPYFRYNKHKNSTNPSPEKFTSSILATPIPTLYLLLYLCKYSKCLKKS